jgi:hypothetical protein
MPGPARIIAIDDELDHLRGLVSGLNMSGWACLQVQYPEELHRTEPCPHVRIVFSDLHLDAGSAIADQSRNFGIVTSLLQETVKPVGPYLLVVWTSFPQYAAGLAAYLTERIVGVPAPVAVVPLDKAGRMDDEGKLVDAAGFVTDLKNLVAEQPQFAALLNWEQNVMGAAAGTVSEIIALARPDKLGAPPPPKLTQVLAQLAKAAVGSHNVEMDRFRAVNKALLPILADRIGLLRGDEEDKAAWASAFAVGDLKAGLAPPFAARLNRLLHVEYAPEAAGGSQRGTVVELPESLGGDAFERRFGIKQDSAEARKDFAIKEESGVDKWSWRLVQIQAPCDEAEKKPGPLPFVLAAEVVGDDRGQVIGAAWGSPRFWTEAGEVHLVLNPRYQVDFSAAEAATLKPVYRLREQIMSEVSHNIHSHGARPGIISFGKR